MIVKVKLKTPVTIGDKSVDEVNIDVDEITGGDIMFAISEASAVKGVVIAYAIDAEVHVQMVCKLTGLARATLMGMKGKDFTSLIGPVRDFFLNAD